MIGDHSFWLSPKLFHSTLLHRIHFSPPIKICFKKGTFLLHLSRELHVEIRFEKKRFFCLMYAEPKHKPSWCKWFSMLHLGILSMAAISVIIQHDCSQLMSWFEYYQLQLAYPSMDHHPVRNLQHGTLPDTSDMLDQSQHLFNITHKSFLGFQLRFYISWNNKAQYAENVAFFSFIDNKMDIQKFINFDVCFKMHTDNDSCYDTILTKLFQMTLKTTK